jgi:hypothetical protein
VGAAWPPVERPSNCLDSAAGSPARWQVASPPSRHARRVPRVPPTATRFAVRAASWCTGCPDAHRDLGRPVRSAWPASVQCPVSAACPASARSMSRARCPRMRCPRGRFQCPGVDVRCPASVSARSASASAVSAPVTSWSASERGQPHGQEGARSGHPAVSADGSIICLSQLVSSPACLASHRAHSSDQRRRLRSVVIVGGPGPSRLVSGSLLSWTATCARGRSAAATCSERRQLDAGDALTCGVGGGGEGI